MFNQQYNFTYNSGKKGYSVTSKTADTKTVVSYKLIVKRQTTSYTSDTQSNIRGILKLEPRTIISKNSDTVSKVSGFVAIMYYAKPDLSVFDPYDKRLAILSNEGTGACPFWDAIYREELNKGGTFTFTVPANHEDSKFVVAENKVAFRDKDDNLRLFVIKETEEIDGNDGPLIEVYCDPEYIDELNDIVIEDKRPQNRTAEYALGQVLEDSRWEVGEVAELGLNSTNFYFMTGIEAINRILDVWGGEIRDRIEVEGNQITGRYIDILTRRGSDTGKRWEIDKDIIEITRLTQSYPKTALYGRGASLETEDGGFSRLLTFEDVEWKVENGDPVDKPKGQKWVGDPDALYKYGRRKLDVEPITGTTQRVYAEQRKYDPSNAYIHRFGIYENGNIEDPEELLWATWNELQEQKRPFENYELDVLLYAEKAGLDHEKVRLGDTTIALDRRFARPIEVEERIIAYEYDVANPDDTGKVELGKFRELFSDDKRLDQIQAQLDSAQGKANHPEIDDDSFPDVKPETPTNFTADPLFKIIQLKWDYDASSYIASYELYASQTPNFNPTSDRLVWRGKTGGYAFEADTDEQWYFRLRAVNTHGTASDFTDEVSASTIKIDAGYDVEPLTITDELIAHDAKIDFAKIANVEITDAMIADAEIDFAKIKNVEIEEGMINVSKLSAISADLGDVKGGSYTTEYIYEYEGDDVIERSLIEKASITLESLNTGIDLGYYVELRSGALELGRTVDDIDNKEKRLTIRGGSVAPENGPFRVLGNAHISGELYVRDRFINYETYNTPGPFDPNVYVTEGGYFTRATSSKKYKRHIKQADIDYRKIRNLKLKSWYDANELEKNHKSTHGLKRYYGAIAEDFEDIGLPEFVVYNSEGEVENFSSRAWLLLIPNINDLQHEVDELKRKIKRMENKNET